MTARELAASPYIAPKDKSISPTTITSVSPIAMMATELMARRMDTARLGLAKCGLMRRKMTATTMTAANSPPMRAAMASEARPRLEKVGFWPGACVTSLLIRFLSKEKPRGQAVRALEARAPLLLTHGAIELLARLLDTGLQNGLECLRVGQDHAILQKLGAGYRAEGRLIRPALIEFGDLRSLFDRLQLAFRRVPADREDLAVQPQALDGAVGMLGADVHILDELDVWVGGEEGAVDVISLAGLIAGVKAGVRRRHEFRVRNRRLDR